MLYLENYGLSRWINVHNLPEIIANPCLIDQTEQPYANTLGATIGIFRQFGACFVSLIASDKTVLLQIEDKKWDFLDSGYRFSVPAISSPQHEKGGEENFLHRTDKQRIFSVYYCDEIEFQMNYPRWEDTIPDKEAMRCILCDEDDFDHDIFAHIAFLSENRTKFSALWKNQIALVAAQ